MLRFGYVEWLRSWLNPEEGDGFVTSEGQPGQDSGASPSADPTAPDVRYLTSHFSEALQSFHATVARIVDSNPVDAGRLSELAGKAGAGSISAEEAAELQTLRNLATRQGRAIGAVYGFFLKFRPYPMLAEIRKKEKLFQPLFGPIMIADGDLVREVLQRHDEFTVDPYGREMIKSMTPAKNGGFDTFILSTDDAEKYIEDKRLLTTVVNSDDPERITELVHEDCMCRLKRTVKETRGNPQGQIDLVTAIARFVPVTLSHHYLGLPAAKERGRFPLNDDMLRYYGKKVAGPDGHTPLPTELERSDGSVIELPDTALGQADGVIPDEAQIYEWIKAAFQNFFNNVQKDIEVQARGVRAYRELLVYLLREINIQRDKLEVGEAVSDTMLTRLLKLQMGIADPELSPNPEVDAMRLGNLRIAENIMGTVVGAVAGQEEATCRLLDSMLRLKEGEYAAGGTLSGGERIGSFDEARELALNVLEGRNCDESRRQLRQYAMEALRLQPQAETLLRECRKEGATIAGSRPIRAGTLIFAAHGSAMQDIENADAFVIGRDPKHYLHYGFGRHKCLGQYVSPVILVETLIAVLALETLRRPDPLPGDSAFPLERRFGRLQLDDNNLYAKTFTLEFDHGGTTSRYFS